MIRILSSARGKALLGLVLLLCLLAGALLFWQTDAGDSAHHTLVGDGYIVQVNKKQFDEFGTGEFADLDLDRFAEHYGLEKISLDDKAALAKIGYEVSPAPPKANP